MFIGKRRLHLLYILIISILVILLLFLFVKLFPFYHSALSFVWHLFFPFILASFIAYLLYPLIDKLHEFHIQKGLAILLIYLIFFGGIIYIGYLGYPAFMSQLQQLNEQLPHLILMYEETVYSLYDSTHLFPDVIQEKVAEMIEKVESNVTSSIEKLLNRFTKVFDFIIVFTIIPVLVFYFLKDYKKIKDFFKKIIPKPYHSRFSAVAHTIDESLGNYLRGQLLVALIISLITWVIYHYLKIDYALLLALFMGLMNLIPYFGPIIGMTPALIIGFTISTKLVLFVIVTTLFVQLLESSLLSPYIVGKSIQIHPVAIIFALLLGAEVGGVLGMIIAVPLLTVIKELLPQFITYNRYN